MEGEFHRVRQFIAFWLDACGAQLRTIQANLSTRL
jgi:hypothetical protein